MVRCHEIGLAWFGKADIVGNGKMSLRVFITVLACGFAVAATPLRGQTSVDPNPTPTPDNTTTRDATRVISTPEVKENISPTSTDSTRPSNLAARSALSPEVKERLRKFEREREAYLQKQRELEKRLKGATEQERERI